MTYAHKLYVPINVTLFNEKKSCLLTKVVKSHQQCLSKVVQLKTDRYNKGDHFSVEMEQALVQDPLISKKMVQVVLQARLQHLTN